MQCAKLVLRCHAPVPVASAPHDHETAAGRRRELLQRSVLFHVLLTSYEFAVAEAEDLRKLVRALAAGQQREAGWWENA